MKKKIFLIGAGKTGTTTIHHFLKNGGLRTTNHNPSINKEIIAKEDFDYDVFSAHPWTTIEKIKWADKNFDSLFIFTTYNNLKYLRSLINHDIRNIKHDKNIIKNYKDINKLEIQKENYDNEVLDYFKNKDNFLYINWDHKSDYKQKICNFLNIKLDNDLSISNESISSISFTNKTENEIMNHYNRSPIVKNKYFKIKNNNIFFHTKDRFYILYFLNINLIKYHGNTTLSNYLFHDIKNDYITKSILSSHNDCCNNKTSFRLEFFENLFKYVLKDFNLQFKNIIEFGPGDCCFLRYCDNLGSNTVALDYDKTVEKICNFHNFFYANFDYTKKIDFKNVWDCYINFDLIYGKSSIDISMSEKNLLAFISNIQKISHDKTKLFYLSWIPSEYDQEVTDKNIEILKKKGFEVYLIKKEKTILFVYPFSINYVITKNIKMPKDYFISV